MDHKVDDEAKMCWQDMYDPEDSDGEADEEFMDRWENRLLYKNEWK